MKGPDNRQRKRKNMPFSMEKLHLDIKVNIWNYIHQTKNKVPILLVFPVTISVEMIKTTALQKSVTDCTYSNSLIKNFSVNCIAGKMKSDECHFIN